jgi:hypothetical protein
MPTQFRIWACLVALGSAVTPHVSSAEFAPNAQAARPLQVGDPAPDFSVSSREVYAS